MSTLLMVVVREVGLIILGWGMMRLTPSGRAGYRGEDTLNTSGRVHRPVGGAPHGFRVLGGPENLGFSGFQGLGYGR